MLGIEETTGYVLREKPYKGSVEPTRLFDSSRWGNHGTHTAITMVQTGYGLWVASYNGTSSKITIGDTNRNVQSLCIWIYPDNHTRSIVDLDGGTHSIEIDASSDITATGWTTPIIYVNASVAAAITLSAWNFIVVTTTTAFEASSLVLGDEATWYDGKAGLWRLIENVITPVQIRDIYHKQAPYFGIKV